MIHLALTIAAFLFLCWVAWVLIQIGLVIFEQVAEALGDFFSLFWEAINGKKGNFARILAFALLGIVALSVVAVVVGTEMEKPGSKKSQIAGATIEPNTAEQEVQLATHELHESQRFPHLMEKAQAGGAMEQYQVGYSYESGDQVPQDYALAAQWYQKSADQGFAAAQYSLGMFYVIGLGVPRDYERAYFWLSLAASANSEQDAGLRAGAVSARDSAAQRLTKAQLIRVQQETVQFLTTHPKPY